MPDIKTARKDAQKAAQRLLETTMVTAAGDLGEAAAARQEAVEACAAARQKGAELVAAAQRQAEELAQQADQAAAQSGDRYRDTWAAALAAGWSEQSLTDLGYQAPDAAGKRSRRRPSPASVRPAVQTTDPSDTSLPSEHVA